MTKHSWRLARKCRACAETFPVIRSSGAQGYPSLKGQCESGISHYVGSKVTERSCESGISHYVNSKVTERSCESGISHYVNSKVTERSMWEWDQSLCKLHGH